MHYISWDDNKSIGIEEIDNDHRHLIGLINDFGRARDEGQSVEVLSELLTKLKAYSLEHFEREESYMIKTGFKNFYEHQEQHLMFIKKITEFEKEHQYDKAFVAIKIMPFMMDWLINHIMTSDKQLAVTGLTVSHNDIYKIS